MFSIAAEFDPRVNEKPLDELPAPNRPRREPPGRRRSYCIISAQVKCRFNSPPRSV